MTAAKYVIHLLKCALKNESPEEKPLPLSWEDIFLFAQSHMTANMVWYSVNQLKNKPDPELWEKWTEVRNKAFAKDITQRNEYEKILAAFREKQIRCLPVKGIFLKNRYPRTDFRTMSDIDLLVDEENLQYAGEIMLLLGYTCKSSGTYHRDVYCKPPVMSIEIHHHLIMNGQFSCWEEYYADSFSKAQSADQYIYQMTDEEFYLFNLIHFYKHYSGGGCGIRFIMDLYVLNHSIYLNLNHAHLEKKLIYLNLLDFRNHMTALSEQWFGEVPASAEFTVTAEYIFNSGTYGTMTNSVQNQIREKGRLRYFLYCVFLPLSVMQQNYPVLKKSPFLLPFFWIWRWISSVITKRNRVILKLKFLFHHES